MKVEYAVLAIVLALLVGHINSSTGVSAPDCAAAYTINGITQMDGAEASKELLELVDKCNKKFSKGDL